MIRLVVATRSTTQNFLAESLLGRSIVKSRLPGVQLRIFPENKNGLPTVYNQAIREAASSPARLVFIHDDVFLLDFFWAQNLESSHKLFDVVGLAGNIRRLPLQPSWAFIDTELTWDSSENLSGSVGHGVGPESYQISNYGKVSRKVALLDGLFLSVSSSILLEKNLFFDERFKFHFYDLDFCRSANLLGLSCGTASIAVIHRSGGGFRNQAWSDGFSKYIEKWGD